MAQLPEAAPIPDAPPLHLKGGNVVMASPLSMAEACFSVPAVRAFRNSRPTAKLAVVTPESLAPLWETVERIDKLIVYPDGSKARHIARLLNDCGLELESSIAWEPSEAATSFAKSGVAQRLGYDLKGHKKLTDRIALTVADGPIEHRVRFYLDLMGKLGINGYLPANFEAPPLPPRPDPPRIGLLPGTEFGPAYQWGLENFRDLGELLLKSKRAQLVILALPGRINEANELDDRLQGRARNFANEFDFPQFLHALPHCSAVVANDGGGAHLAAHLGVPVIALFGPGDPEATRPLGRIHTVVSQHAVCAPCLQKSCPLTHHRCMEELSPTRVYEALLPYLQSQP